MVTELPKVELHLHLDCSLSYRAVTQLAPGVTYDQYQKEFVAPTRCLNLAEFLAHAHKGVSLLQNEAALRIATEDVFEQLRADNIIYAELRFAPLLHTQQGLTPERVVEIVVETADRLTRETGIECRLILCTLRHFSEEQSLRTAELVRAYAGTRVAALDLAGDEAGFPITSHVKAFEFARTHGLHRTAHAGEASGPESVWETIRLLRPTRIGHGTRSIEDPSLVSYLHAHRLHLELCPSSNVQVIPSIGSLQQHPIDKLYRANVPLNINTDTRMLTPTTMTREYADIERTFGWAQAEFHHTNLLAVAASFADEGTKERIRGRLDAAYAPALS